MNVSDVAIIICTRNKESALKKTVDTIIKYAWEYFELIIVDNNSTDDTLGYCNYLIAVFAQSTIKFKYVFEPILGLSKARNTGLQNSFSKWVIFLDDDCIPSPEFLISYKQMLLKKPECKLAGGPITVRWPESGRPSWLPKNYEWLYGAIDNGGGDQPRHLKKDETINGGNLLLHRQTVIELGGFNEKLGHVGDKFGGNEEHFLIETLKEKFSDNLFWSPSATVEHHFPLNRLTLSHAKSRSRDAGYDRANSDFYKKKYFLITLRLTFYVFKYPFDNSTIRKSNYLGYLFGSVSSISNKVRAWRKLIL